MLPDVIEIGLKLVICGTAAGSRSAKTGQYYAGSGNKFWTILAAVGLTPRVLTPPEYLELLKFGIGLTDLVKGQAGADSDIDFASADLGSFRKKIEHSRPRWLCFNGKGAAKVFLGAKRVEYGPLSRGIGDTRLFVAPSTSGAANGVWDASYWQEVADLTGQDIPGLGSLGQT